MRVVLFANNVVGSQIAGWLAKSDDEVAGLVLNAPAKRRQGDDIVKAAGLPPDRVFDGAGLDDAPVQARVRALGADMGVSVFFGHLLRGPWLRMFPRGIVNLHPALLPYNRGAHPNVWSIIDGTPAGVTLHMVDEGIDTGPVLAQRRVEVRPTETGETLYRRLEAACVELFQESWAEVRAGTLRPVPQPHAAGTSHRSGDVASIDALDLDRPTTARAVIDVLRARTFPPYRGAYFTSDGRRIYLRLQMIDEDDLEGPR